MFHLINLDIEGINNEIDKNRKSLGDVNNRIQKLEKALKICEDTGYTNLDVINLKSAIDRHKRGDDLSAIVGSLNEGCVNGIIMLQDIHILKKMGIFGPCAERLVREMYKKDKESTPAPGNDEQLRYAIYALQSVDGLMSTECNESKLNEYTHDVLKRLPSSINVEEAATHNDGSKFAQGGGGKRRIYKFMFHYIADNIESAFVDVRCFFEGRDFGKQDLLHELRNAQNHAKELVGVHEELQNYCKYRKMHRYDGYYDRPPRQRPEEQEGQSLDPSSVLGNNTKPTPMPRKLAPNRTIT